MATRKRPPASSKTRAPARPKPTPRRQTDALARRPKPTHRGHGIEIAHEFIDGMAYVADLIREIPNFPQPGVMFRDITPLLANPKGFHIVLDAIAEHFVGVLIDAVVGIESRGFIFGGALAARLNASFVPVRKPGKLPYRTDKVSYSLEYGEAELEMHRDSLREGARVLVVDDLLATGGTAAAAGELVHRQGAFVVAYAFVIELTSLGGRERLMPTPVVAFLKYS
jgi:adenine phosphoribosyltransferase